MRFEGKVAVVTGAGGGIGEAYAKRLAAVAGTYPDIGPASGAESVQPTGPFPDPQLDLRR